MSGAEQLVDAALVLVELVGLVVVLACLAVLFVRATR